MVGCGCETCTSDDPRDRRTRHGALVELEAGTLLVDTPPELRLQLLEAGVDRVDAVWYTHVHADHVHGIDDLRVFTVDRSRDLPVYVAREHAEGLRRRFSYIFDPTVETPRGTSKPEVRLRPFSRGEALEILGARVRPLAVPHGPTTVYGFRVGALGYVTDAKALPPDVVEALRGVRVLVLNSLWFGRPHPTHFNVEEALDAAEAVGAERTYLTHLTHRVRHADLAERLPPGVLPAYDGLRIEVPRGEGFSGSA